MFATIFLPITFSAVLVACDLYTLRFLILTISFIYSSYTKSGSIISVAFSCISSIYFSNDS